GGEGCARYRGARSDANYSRTTTHCVLLAVSKPCPSGVQIASANSLEAWPRHYTSTEAPQREPGKDARAGRPREWKRQGPSSRLDIRGLHHLRPGRKLGLDSLAEFFGLTGDDIVAERPLALLPLGRRPDLDDLAVEERDHLFWGAGGNDEADEAFSRDVGIAAFDHRRHIRQRLRADPTGDRERAQLAVVDQGHDDGWRAHSDRGGARDDGAPKGGP